ncbi:TPA: hypothetical protein ACFNMI_000551 [Neisseria bacilliformis]|uniref:hypothetical protein n=1 Tax=Neisseria bacilliformis TaxID=267212 RepID=UPI0028E25ACE|nr:hypothetical protein [Neisseria bacilliformis]
MSLNPVYLWNPQNFPDPQAMLPDGFDAAHRIVSEWADQPLPQGVRVYLCGVRRNNSRPTRPSRQKPYRLPTRDDG